MDRRRIALIAAGVVLFGGVVGVLRTAGAGEPGPPTPTSAPPPTSLAPFAAEGVLVPNAGAPPEAPHDLVVTAGSRRLQLRWAGGAPGYEVRWGVDRADRSRLVTRSAIQLDGLEDERSHVVEVYAVDAFGQRSAPARSSGTPHDRPLGGYASVDRFDRDDSPDPTRWRLVSRPNCARVTPGRDDDGRRLVLTSNCAAAPATLRARTPFVLRDADELGRFAVETDAPGSDGELALDLVPGPVSVVGGDGLPPGTVRLLVETGNGTTSVRVRTSADVPTEVVREVPALDPGFTHRWELALRRDGARVLLDGELVATSPVVPTWSEATALVSVSGPTGQRVAFDLVAVDAAPASPPPLLPAPAVEAAVAAQPRRGGAGEPPLPGVTGGQLRMALLHTDAAPEAPALTASVAGVEVPLRPAVPGTPWRAGVAYPVVADLPVEALGTMSGDLVVTVLSGLRMQVTHAELELRGTPPSVARTTAAGPGAPGPELARVDGAVLDAGGRAVAPGAAVRPGRLVFDLALSGRSGAPVAGLAGFSVRVDDRQVAVVPTDRGGPGIAGRYRLALNTSGFSAGPHMIEVRLFGTSGETRPTSAFIPFFIGR
ncbi:fibronectin type III domain-containing protein [Saccharothrix lopnurensis]|uniref:Fibronectin type III domain-containing protein n=1 Tax=Saccharothrix lopnurensis TaxID=1670621 RepID=A0ABW1NY02_9PSEU